MDIKKQYLAFVVSSETRDRLVARFPPKFPRVVCHHVTVEFNLTDESYPTLFRSLQTAKWTVVGYATNDGVEALVVAANESTVRPDGKVYHITLSLAPGRRPVESNDLLAAGWQPLDQPVPLFGLLRLEAK